MEASISLSLTPFNGITEPNEGNVRHWMDGIFSRYMPTEQARWNQSNIDTLFYAGNQSFINRNFSFSPGVSANDYYFNLCQQPVNMITGRQRQHRKSIVYQASDGADPHTTDQYTRLMFEVRQKQGIDEQFSKSCELSAVAGLNLMQPYLDFTGDDPAQGELKVKIWEYNSFIVDPYFRNPDMSDAQFVWCQEYITRNEAEARFPDKIDKMRPMAGTPTRYGSFYFLPENYNIGTSDMYVLSYVWYKWRKKKKRLYSKKRNQFFDFAGGEKNLEQILYHIDDLEEVSVETPCWKVAVVLNDQLMFIGDNPLWDGPECPFIPNFWNYDPHISQPDLRSRSLIFPMRSPQFLFNYKVITNNDITAATINAGWKRKIGAVANEDNLKKAGQGWDVIINEGYELSDCEKIIPSGVPESDLALAQQFADLISNVANIQTENWAGQQDKQISSLTMLLKQDASLMVFQKYFDQWDHALKILGERMLQIALNNWNEAKVEMMLGEEPSPHFYSKIFAKYKTVVEPGLLTPTQRNLQAQQMLEINERFGREVLPPSMIIKDMNIQGKAEIMKYLEGQEQQAQQMNEQKTAVEHAFEDAKLKELYSRATMNIASARERHGRAESNIGLFEERLSEITRNRALATKDKMAALAQLVETISKFGELETAMKMNDLQNYDFMAENKENIEKADAKSTSLANDFQNNIMNSGDAGTQLPSQEMQGQVPMQNQPEFNEV